MNKVDNNKQKTWNFQHLHINQENLSKVSNLEDDFNIDPLDIEDILTDTQLSKVEIRKEYVFVALHFPRLSKISKRIIEKELFFILNKDFLIVINKHNSATIERFNDISIDLLGKDITAAEYFYEILDFMITSSFRFVTKFKEEILIIEKNIFELDNSDQIHEIQLAKRNLINFSSIIFPLEIAINDIQIKNCNTVMGASKDDHFEKLDDSLDKVKKMISSVSNFKEQVDMLSESNEALTARSTNEAIKTLTSISMLILVPNIIISFFGMNVYYGWAAEGNYLPLILILCSIIFSIVSTLFLLKKFKWL